MQLYSGPLSMFGAKAQIALHEKGLPFDLVMVPFDMERLYEPKHPAVERINPKRQVPVLIDGSTEIRPRFSSKDAAPTAPLWPTSVVIVHVRANWSCRRTRYTSPTSSDSWVCRALLARRQPLQRKMRLWDIAHGWKVN
jgi:glutathione S-transferase